MDKREKNLGISEEDINVVKTTLNPSVQFSLIILGKTTSKKYLEKHFSSIRKMYELYQEKCLLEEKEPMKYWLDHVFCT